MTYQACTAQYCIPPEDVPVLFDLAVAPEGAQVQHLNQEIFRSKVGNSYIHQPVSLWLEKSGFLLVFLGLFVGGLALNLTPCIYPLIPITVSYFGGRNGVIRGGTLAHGLLYITGLALTNSILDFYADWCVPCRALEEKVFKDPEVVKLSRHFVTIKIDLTREHPEQKKVLKLYGIRGVPTVVFLNRHGKAENDLRIESFVKPNEILRRMQQLIDNSIGQETTPRM